jgi:hypothetical protein
MDRDTSPAPFARVKETECRYTADPMTEYYQEHGFLAFRVIIGLVIDIDFLCATDTSCGPSAEELWHLDVSG